MNTDTRNIYSIFYDKGPWQIDLPKKSSKIKDLLLK